MNFAGNTTGKNRRWEVKNIGRKDKRKIIAVVFTVMNVLILGASIFCMVRTGENNRKINAVSAEYTWTANGRNAVLVLTDGREVKLSFGNKAVKVYDAYRYKDSVYEILLFVRSYGETLGITFQRTNTEMAGEFRLHTLLYEAGYRRDNTGDLDWDYTEDLRPYVNAASRIIGWCGV